MIFELISWLYISLICLVWGNRILKLGFGISQEDAIDFPIICFIGLSALGIISYFLSLVIPLFPAVKLFLQIPALLFLLKSENRRGIICQLRKCFGFLSVLDKLFLGIILLMLLFISSSLVIHPDTLNYHLLAIRIFEKYGSIPGIANLRMDLGFQSNWFAELAFFDFSLTQHIQWFPLNGCVMGWFVFFLVSKSAVSRTDNATNKYFSAAIWYLGLLLFSILSWTQIRLTAASLSPDFIAAISIWLVFYFFIGGDEKLPEAKTDALAVFFIIIALSVKLSTVPILFIFGLVLIYAYRRDGFTYVVRIVLATGILLSPLLIRNIISTGYPLFPSSFAAIYPAEWQLNPAGLIKLQHYITSYARFPVIIVNSEYAYQLSFLEWIPVWWRNLYAIDKLLIILIVSGIGLDISFFKTWKKSLHKRMLFVFIVAIAGSVFWFLKAPDPRFGTGFLLALIYCQYAPFAKIFNRLRIQNSFRLVQAIKFFSMACILMYTGYRAVYFFNPRQLLFPGGIKNAAVINPDCDDHLREMILNEENPPGQLPDSCRNFMFRGTTIRHGFKPAR